MPRIISYSAVVDQAGRQGFVSLYYNSGAFGFPDGAGRDVRAVGWIGTPDPTIRPAALALAHSVPPPYESNLASLATRAWLEVLRAGAIWVLPKSHWAYELDFGSAAWMPDALRDVGVDSTDLSARNDASAIEFAQDEAAGFTRFLEALLTHLAGSDFALIFPGRDALCTVHHHKQLWWTTPDPAVHDGLRALSPPPSDPAAGQASDTDMV